MSFNTETLENLTNDFEWITEIRENEKAFTIEVDIGREPDDDPEWNEFINNMNNHSKIREVEEIPNGYLLEKN